MIIEVDLLRCLNDGIKFYISENNVVLTKESIAPTYFKNVLIEN